eukprot:1115350-Pyramimonas_sp.AAC.1
MDWQLGLKVDWPAVRWRHIGATSGQGSHQSKGRSSGSQRPSWDSWEGGPGKAQGSSGTTVTGMA